MWYDVKYNTHIFELNSDHIVAAVGLVSFFIRYFTDDFEFSRFIVKHKKARVREKLDIPADTVLYRGVGCAACRDTGYQGRRGVFELMTLNDELRELILASRSSGEIRRAARGSGLSSLSEDGWRVVREGMTTVDEVLRVTKDERATSTAD